MRLQWGKLNEGLSIWGESVMDTNTTVQAMKDRVQGFCEIRDWSRFHNQKDLAIGISTEANELLSEFRFKTAEEMAKMKTDGASIQVKQELADVLFFVLRFAQMYDVDLDDALTAKLALNNKRYPVEQVKGKNNKYDEY